MVQVVNLKVFVAGVAKIAAPALNDAALLLVGEKTTCGILEYAFANVSVNTSADTLGVPPVVRVIVPAVSVPTTLIVGDVPAPTSDKNSIFFEIYIRTRKVLNRNQKKNNY